LYNRYNRPMSAQFINLNDLVYRAYTLGLEHNDSKVLSKSQVLDFIFGRCPVEHHESESESDSKPQKKKERKSRAPAKPRAVPDDECRCCARAFSEGHVEGGKLKVMRDDEANLYGDRCKFKKNGDSEFCKHHIEKQPHGVWGGEYSGKFKLIMAKAAKSSSASSSDSESDKPKTKIVIKKANIVYPAAAAAAAPAPPAKVIIKKAAAAATSAKKVIQADDEEIFSDDELFESSKLAKKGVKFDSIELDDISLFIDASGNVYDPEDEEKIGKYDRNTKKWLSGGLHVYNKKYEGETDDDETDDE
jgi:hypothetical protein